ncbi:MAG: TonB family protein [Spirochaetes bacterium]|nr:TonB family protein [Spirochaetota bacterium]
MSQKNQPSTKFQVFIQRNGIRLIILSITILIHIILLLVITISTSKKQEREDNTIFKMVDVKEFVPPVEKEPPKEDVVEIAKQDDIAEDIIETDKEILELDIEYLPQHKISELPAFPIKTIYSNLEYPPLARKQGIEGIVYLELYIDNKGNIQKIEILKDPGFGFSDAAIRAFDNIRCSPAKANGIPVAVKIRQPIKFRLK